MNKMRIQTVCPANWPKVQERCELLNSTHVLRVLPDCRQASAFTDKISLKHKHLREALKGTAVRVWICVCIDVEGHVGAHTSIKMLTVCVHFWGFVAFKVPSNTATLSFHSKRVIAEPATHAIPVPLLSRLYILPYLLHLKSGFEFLLLKWVIKIARLS